MKKIILVILFFLIFLFSPSSIFAQYADKNLFKEETIEGIVIKIIEEKQIKVMEKSSSTKN